MRRSTWGLVAAVILVGAAVTGGAVTLLGGTQATAPTPEPALTTAKVERGKLSDLVSQYGILTFRARPDGSPYSVINQARGTYTQLPDAGDKVGCGDVLYRVDEKPVVLLCGAVPAYRNLRPGDAGEDVRQLNRNLHALGFDAGAAIDPDETAFTGQTGKALEALQDAMGSEVTGALDLGNAVFLPEPVRIASVGGVLGGSAQPVTEVAQATSNTPEVQVALDPSQHGAVKVGDPARVTLPGNISVTGTVDRLGTVARAPAGPNANPIDATIPAYISLDDPAAARGFDAAPVRVQITTEGVDDALSVPVIAIVGKAGGGFAVEVVRPDGQRVLVEVRLGLFDSGAGRVEVEGDLVEGDDVVVPST